MLLLLVISPRTHPNARVKFRQVFQLRCVYSTSELDAFRPSRVDLNKFSAL